MRWCDLVPGDMIYSNTFNDFHIVVSCVAGLVTYLAIGRDYIVTKYEKGAGTDERIDINEFTIFLASKK